VGLRRYADRSGIRTGGGCRIIVRVTDAFSLGLELKNHNLFPNPSSWAHSALFLGPVAAYAQEHWWATLTVLPQVVGFKGATEDNLVLDDLERIEVRLLFGFHI